MYTPLGLRSIILKKVLTKETHGISLVEAANDPTFSHKKVQICKMCQKQLGENCFHIKGPLTCF